MTDKMKAAVEWLRTLDVDDRDYGDAQCLLAHIDAEPARIAAAVAAAREEQREACARVAADADCDCPEFEDSCRTKGRESLHDGTASGVIADIIRATPLDSTPLADRIAELERQMRVMIGIREDRDEAVSALRGLRREVSAKLTGRDSEPGEFGRAWRTACAVLSKYPEEPGRSTWQLRSTRCSACSRRWNWRRPTASSGRRQTSTSTTAPHGYATTVAGSGASASAATGRG